jgi:hypothetical protein
MGASGWPLSRAQTVAAASLGVLVAVTAVLAYGAPPLLICWMGVGPAPEPQTSECLTRLLNAATPFQRLQYDQPLVADMAIALVAFAVTVVVVLGASIVARRVAR